MHMKNRIVWALFIALILGSCQRLHKLDFQLYRFIDHLNIENIQYSPFFQIQDKKEVRNIIFPKKSFPMQDLGVGENPYELKRKLRIGGIERNVLFAPPKSQFSYTLDISQDSILEFGIGIIREKDSVEIQRNTSSKENGVNFRIVLEINGKKKTIFQEYLSSPQKEQEPSLSFSTHKIDLPYKHKKARVIFITKGGPKNISFWANPVLYRKGKNVRNVVLISLDTLRADHLGCYGYKRPTSPNIDALALEGMQFLNVYAQSPWTLPSHISLFTSLNNINHQVYYDDEKMDPALITLADVLRKNQIFCSAITGGGFVSAVYGFSKGFDTYNEGAGGVFQQNAAELTSRAVSEWLDKNSGKNFFLFIHTYQPHNPYACPYPYKSMFLEEGAKWTHIDLLSHLGGKSSLFKGLSEEERQNVISLYDGEIRYTDEMLIGPLLKKLKELDIYDQTMIILTSDHGEEFYEHNSWGHGQNLYDESLKVPLVVKFPGSRFKGRKISSIVRLVDVFPTVLDEFGIDVSDFNLDGESLLPLIKEKKDNDRTFLADIGGNLLNSHIPQKIAMNHGKVKLILNKKFTKEDLAFFIYPPPQIPPLELYDLTEDPFEKKNIIEDNSSLVKQLVSNINEIYSKPGKRKTGKPEIDEKLKEQLRALGYIR